MASLSVDQGLSLLKDSKFSDMTIICGDHSFKVHKVIVCSASPFFAKCLEGNFKEATDGSVTLGETESFILGLALVHIYTHDYSPEAVRDIWKQVKPPAKGLSDQLANTTQALGVYELADWLLMQDFRAVACDNFKQVLSTANWGAGHDGCADLVTLLREVYERVPAGASDIRVPVIHIAARKAYDYSGPSQKVIDVLNKYEPIAFGIWKLLRGY